MIIKIIPFKDRTIDPDIKVEVYKNLHKNLFSIRQKGKVVAHVDNFILKDVEFIVREKGRQLVLKTRQKNIHAFLKGYITFSKSNNKIRNQVRYNPYEMSTFINDKKEPIYKALMCYTENNKIYYNPLKEK